ncbi:MAG TPA: hypothetical protein VGS27_28485 [Candidatus Sulfotelmatobacter sp.]|nr:hypothetical protein [Candidatus Sulfotelmatobacter sp.]
MKGFALLISVFLVTFAASSFAQLPADYSRPEQNVPGTPLSSYTPKYKGDPSRSDSEFDALAYMRVVIRAEKQFNKQYGHYALTLNQLVHSGNFTKRMVDPNRGDYIASYKGKNDSYTLTMAPKSPDANHRYFYTDDDGKIRGEEGKPADANSPIVK